MIKLLSCTILFSLSIIYFIFPCAVIAYDIPETIRVGLEYKYKNVTSVPISDDHILLGSGFNGEFESEADFIGNDFSVSVVSETIIDMRHEQLEAAVYRFLQYGSSPKDWNIDGLTQELARMTGVLLPISQWASEEEMDTEKLKDHIIEAIDKHVEQKNANVPEAILRLVEKSVLLQELDALWKDHIATLDYMRHTIVLRAYGQKDPLNEYKKEAFNLFSDMLNQLGEKVTFILLRTVIQNNSADELQNKQTKHTNLQEIHETPSGMTNSTAPEPEKATPFQYNKGAIDPNNPATWGKVARNDLCPCGSGKKYKHCHGQV